jgi:hypothetical protein
VTRQVSLATHCSSTKLPAAQRTRNMRRATGRCTVQHFSTVVTSKRRPRQRKAAGK